MPTNFFDKKTDAVMLERTFVSHISPESPPEVASLADKQTRELADSIMENKEVDQTEENSTKIQVPPASPQIGPTGAASRSPSPLRLPSVDPVPIGPC